MFFQRKWICNGKTFHSLAEKTYAVQESYSSKKPIIYPEFDFWKNYTFWHIEPKESIEELYASRAHTIRDSFKTVRLMYSGGSDSWTILKVFYDNNIHIDEIAIRYDVPVDNLDFDATSVTIPSINLIKRMFPKSKIKMVNLDSKDYASFISSNFFRNSPRGRNSVRILEKELWDKYFPVNDSTANVKGIDKPFLLYYQNQWWLYHIDIHFDNDVDNSNIVAFFLGDPHLFNKTAHMCKKFIQSKVKKTLWNEFTSYNTYDQQLQWNIASGRYINPYGFLSKTGANLGFGKDGKTYRNRKDYETAKILDEKLLKIYHNKQSELDYLKEFANYNDITRDWIGVFSRFYSLEKPVKKTVDDLFPNGFNAQLI